MSQPDARQPETHGPTAQDWPVPEYSGDHVNAPLLGIVALLGAVVFVLIFCLLQAWFYTWREDLTAAKILPADDPQTALGRMLIEQREQTDTYHWVDRKADIRAIPIDRAMTIVAGEMAAAQKNRPSEVKHDDR